jgi:hypothetical protein
MKTRRISPAIAPTNGTQSGKRGITSDRVANSAGVVALNITNRNLFSIQLTFHFTVALSLCVDV